MRPKQLNALLQSAIKNRFPILIVGAPGVGKSDIVAQACEQAGARLIISHPVVSDPTDYKGLPFVVDGHAEFLPFGDLRALCETREDTVFFLDDLGQAAPSVQAAAMQLLLARRINGHKVSDTVTFISATNRRQDKAGVQGILEPVKSRFVSIVNLEPNVQDWSEWALTHDMPAELIAFIRFREGNNESILFNFKATADLVNSSCPRTVANVGRLLNSGLPRDLEYEVIAGAAGEAFAVQFLAFLKIFRSLPNPDLVLMNPAAGDVPKDPAVLYALTGALAYRASQSNFPNVIAYANRLPDEFSVLLVTDCLHKDTSLTNTKAFIDWSVKHTDILI